MRSDERDAGSGRRPSRAFPVGVAASFIAGLVFGLDLAEENWLVWRGARGGASRRPGGEVDVGPL